jgi:hypothetical protein
VKTKHEKLMTEFDHDWNDLSLFEKLPVRKTANPKRDNWKRDRKAARNAKHMMQEKNYA